MAIFCQLWNFQA